MSKTTPNGTTIHHADHGLTEAHLAFVDEILANTKPGFFIVRASLPDGLPDLECSLYGPAVGDEPITDEQVSYTKRNGRPGPSRLIDRPTRPARSVVVCGVAGDGAQVFTAYGTRADEPTPREWWDPTMTPTEAAQSCAFWQDHALAAPKSGA